MAYWKTGLKPEDEWFENISATAQMLYIKAGAWAMQQVFGKPLPTTEWFIPAAKVRAWGKKNAATILVQHRIWERAELHGRAGYIYLKIREENTVLFLRRQREEDLAIKRRKRSVVLPDNP